VIEKMKKTEEEIFKGLRKFNGVMGFLHLFQGILMVILSNASFVTVTYNKPVYSPGIGIGSESVAFFDVRIGPLVAMFLFISATAHFLLSTVLYEWYVEKLKKHINPARWYEYSFSASLMIAIIAMLTAIYDFGTILALFTLTVVMNFMGLMMEIHNQTTKKNRLDILYNRMHSRVCTLGSYIHTPYRSYRCRTHICDRYFCLNCDFLQLICSEHGSTIQKDRQMERLSLRRKSIYHT
jgi:hypothetical protein